MRALVLAILVPLLAPAPGGAEPTSVTIAGSLQSELGCPGDWDPGCLASALAYDPTDGVWQATLWLPAGSYEYKAALDGSWDVNYGANGQLSGANIPIALATDRHVRFYYDHGSHWVTDELGSRIVTAPGSFQSELGCPGDWQPDCLRSWLQDVDGDGVYTFETTALPPGVYEARAAVNESWDESYGAGGAPGGANLAFVVSAPGTPIRFRFDGATNVLTVPEPGAAPAAAGMGVALVWGARRRRRRVWTGSRRTRAMLRPP